MKKSNLKIGLAAICLFIIDQFSKWLVINYLKQPFELTSWFSLKYEENLGIAWSIPIPPEVIIPLNVILLGLLIFYMPRIVDLRHKESVLGLSLVIGGALGNIYDRFAHGFVVDFISIGWWPVFNLADAFLTIGIFIILLFYGTIRRHSRR